MYICQIAIPNIYFKNTYLNASNIHYNNIDLSKKIFNIIHLGSNVNLKLHITSSHVGQAM